MEERTDGGPDRPSRRGERIYAFFGFFGFAIVAFAIYAASLPGPFVSDDHLYTLQNATVREFGAGSFLAILDPSGDAVQTTANYAPVHILAHAIEWRIWGEDTTPYHVVNVLLHCLNAVLLVALLEASRIPRIAALAAGAIFVVHPANVEAVAWISQLKTLLCLGFALAALLLLRERPRLSAAWFALGLLSKPVAAFALPAAAAYVWAWRRDGRARREHWQGLGLYALALALYAVPELLAFAEVGRAYATPYPDPLTQLRSIASIGAHYLVMAATGFGLSAFHEPSPVATWRDPWLWAGLLLGVGLLARIAVMLRRGCEEAAWWLGAAAAFAPVAQVFPFYFAMGDRYLYCILPGLLGGSLLFGAELIRSVERRLPWLASPVGARWLRIGALALTAALALQFALHAAGRAGLWTSEYRLLFDGGAQYPEGGTGHFAAALLAAAQGDADQAFASLARANERGYHFIRSYQLEPGLAPLRSDPRFEAMLIDVAGRQIAYAESRGLTSVRDRRGLAYAHFVHGDVDAAIEILEALIREGRGPQDPMLADLQTMRRERARRQRE